MASGWRYRVASVAGTAVLTAVAVTVVNHPAVQGAFALVPYVGQLAPVVLSNGALAWTIATTLAVTLMAMWPVFKPRPRRILDTILLTQKRLLLSMIALAALGYFDYTYRLPRATLLLTTAFLLVVLPLYVVAIRRRPQSTSRAVIVGDDPDTMADLLDAADVPVLGYVSPPSSFALEADSPAEHVEISDGGTVESRLAELQNLGGLSRLDEVFVQYDVDTALLAFAETDRAEFFGALGRCHDHGVAAKVHRDRADSVLVADEPGEELVDVDVEPWDWQDRVVKRVFDVAFAACGLVVLSPVIAGIAVAIKAEDGGSLLYSQARTAELGETFTVYKFRSMIENAEDGTGATLSEEDKGGVDPRVTRVGRVLRRTHLDEIPQLWSILVGDMSVVGPRPERPELESDIEEGVFKWRQRWFVKPGLTGLAQINDVTGHEPRKKLRYDIEYIRRQSFWFDLAIVIRQIWNVLGDVVETVRSNH